MGISRHIYQFVPVPFVIILFLFAQIRFSNRLPLRQKSFLFALKNVPLKLHLSDGVILCNSFRWNIYLVIPKSCL